MHNTRFLGGGLLRRCCWIVLALLLTAVVAACGSSKSTQSTTEASATSEATASSPASAEQASGATITIANFQFTSPPSVSPGATVTVKNADSVEHSVTADSGKKFDVDIEGNETATFTAPSEPGTYAYHCSYHPMMHGELIVQ
jgi:plastocyanin